MTQMDFYNGPINAEETEFRDYFFSLHHERFNLKNFILNWNGMKESFSPKSLHRALQKTASIISLLPENQAQELDNFLLSPKGTERWANLFYDKLSALNGRQLASVGWSLGELEIRPSRNFLIEWRDKLHKKIRAGYLNHMDFRDVMRGLSGLQIHPGERFMNSWFVQSRPHLPSLNFTELASMVKISGDMGAKSHQAFLDDCVAQADFFLNKPNIDIKPGDLRAYLAGITMLSAVADLKVDKQHIRKIIHETARLEVPETGTQVLFHQAASFFDLEGYKDYPWKDDLKAEWKSKYTKAFNKVSGFVRFPVEVKGPHYLPDVSGMYKSSKVIIFLDGPNRFVDRLNGGVQYNGHTILKTALMEKTLETSLTDATALRICYADFRAAADQGINYQSILDQMAEAKPGVYRSTFNDETISLAPMRA